MEVLSVFQWTLVRHCGCPNKPSVTEKQDWKGKMSLRLNAKLRIALSHQSLPFFLIFNGSSTRVISEIYFRRSLLVSSSLSFSDIGLSSSI